MNRNPDCLDYIGDHTTPSLGILINHYKEHFGVGGIFSWPYLGVFGWRYPISRAYNWPLLPKSDGHLCPDGLDDCHRLLGGVRWVSCHMARSLRFNQKQREAIALVKCLPTFAGNDV